MHLSYPPGLNTRSIWGQSRGAQFAAAWKAAEAGLRVTAARGPGEWRTALVEFWQRGLDCLRPAAEVQTQAARFAAALGRHTAGGMETVSEPEYRRRLAVCEVCGFFRDAHCLRCGCRVDGDVVAKARWRSETCPLGRWA